MPVVRAADNATFDLKGNTIASFAAPASGAAETIMYRLSVPAGNPTPSHRHDHEEVFHLTEGSLAMELGDEKVDVAAGDTVIIPAGEFHSVTSTGEGEAHLLCVMPVGTLFIRADGEGAVPPWGE